MRKRMTKGEYKLCTLDFLDRSPGSNFKTEKKHDTTNMVDKENSRYKKN
jgi:hypothetical protein